METANTIPAGTIIRDAVPSEIIFIVESAYEADGETYFTGNFVHETTNIVIAHISKTVLAEGWYIVDESDDNDDDDEYWQSSMVDDFYDDAEALASIGWGTDEDYGYFGGGDDF